MSDMLTIAGRQFHSRLFVQVGTIAILVLLAGVASVLRKRSVSSSALK
jgi:thiazole synthase ThiGH ThiG subunit